MSVKTKVKTMTDCAMTLLLPFLMAYSLIGERLHERLGVIMFGLFLVHHALNFGWWRGIAKGAYPLPRILQTGTNLLLLVIMAALPVSGVISSRHLFTFLPVSNHVDLFRKIHLAASNWGLLLMAFHLGIHWNVICSRMKWNILKSDGICVKGIYLMISLYGIWAFMKRSIADYLFLKTEYVFFDSSEPVALFLIDYLAVIVLFAAIGNDVIRLSQKWKRTKRSASHLNRRSNENE